MGHCKGPKDFRIKALASALPWLASGLLLHCTSAGSIEQDGTRSPETRQSQADAAVDAGYDSDIESADGAGGTRSSATGGQVVTEGQGGQPAEGTQDNTDDPQDSASGGVADTGDETPDSDIGTELLEPAFFAGITAAHNAVRAAVATDVPLPDLRWSPTVAEVAQTWADSLAQNCGFEHSSQAEYGENLYKAWGLQSTPERVVQGWAAELACWDYGPVSLAAENCDMACTADLNASGCGHYTQIVWRDTQEVGCGYATCDDAEIWVCNYYPPGNYLGQEPY